MTGTRENIGRVLGSSKSSAGNYDAGDLHFTTQAELLAACPSTPHICWPRCNKPNIDIKTTTATNRPYRVAAHSKQIHERHTL